MSPEEPNARESPPSPLQKARLLLGLLFVVLILQGILGIYANLFVKLALPASVAVVLPVVFTNPVVSAHFVVALVLIGLAAAFIAVGKRTDVPGVRAWGGALALDFVVTSYLGYHFVAAEEAGYSFAMEMGFFVAIVLVVFLLYRTGSLAPRPQESGSRTLPDVPSPKTDTS